jgi:nucleoside-diphosphate-sugar epimerase
VDVVIAGGHGKVGRRLARLLAARGDRVRGLIRNPDHADDLRSDGSEPVVCDLESATDDDVAAVLAAVLHEPRTVAIVIYVSSGDQPIDEALERLLEDRP